VFERDLLTCGRLVAIPDPIADTAIIVASTLPAAEIRPLALDLINNAQRTLDLELFDLTDTTIVHALTAAHQRGVRVHVLLDPSQGTSRPAAAALSAASVDVRWYRTRGELLHAKAVVADGASILFGSANWSGGGFARNHEIDIEIAHAAAIATQMEAQMRLDWSAAAGS
jgi:cardiolipin synthase A/B